MHFFIYLSRFLNLKLFIGKMLPLISLTETIGFLISPLDHGLTNLVKFRFIIAEIQLNWGISLKIMKSRNNFLKENLLLNTKDKNVPTLFIP